MKGRAKKGFSVVLAAAVCVSTLASDVGLSSVKAAGTESGIQLTDEDVNERMGEVSYDRTSVHDPSVVVGEDGTYYVFGSHMGVSKSTDLINWESVTGESTTSTLFGDADGNVLSYEEAFKDNAYTGTVTVAGEDGINYQVDFGTYDAAEWISGNTVQGNMWAPDVIYNETMDKWCMYLSLNGATWNSNVILLTADEIDGTYVYQGPVVYSGFSTTDSTKSFKDTDLELVIGEQEELPEKYQKIADSSWGTYWPHAIDPCVFYDEEGKLWMSYGSWSGGIYVLELDESTGLRDYTVAYEDTYDELGASCTSDPYFGTKIAGGYYVSGEGSYIQHIGDYYYLFMSYGFYSPEGGYNMRVFRSETPDGDYVDEEGDSAIFNRYVMNYSATSSSYNYGMKLMGNYKWDTMDQAEVAQGHNSAFVDADGKAYVVYHTKFADGTASHEIRVHQMFTNEDGWLVAAPYEYSGETISETGYDMDAMTGTYGMITMDFQVAYANLEYAVPESITLEADGTISGTYEGTWSRTEGTPYVTLNVAGTEYKGVFTEQVIDGSNITTMCFTAMSDAGVTIWGSGEPTDDMAVAQAASDTSIVIPENTLSDITLPTVGLSDTTISWSSDNEAVLSAEGKVTTPEEDTPVTLTETIRKGEYYYQRQYQVTVKAQTQNDTDSMVVGSYFTGEAVDISKGLDQSISVSNPFYYGTNNGLDLSGGVTIEFDAEATGDVHVLGTILSFLSNGGAGGRLYFTPGSYLGYNAAGSYFDANLLNYGLVTDYIGDQAHVAINITEDGFTVTVNDEVAYTQEILTTENGAGSIEDYTSLLDWLATSADTLYFGYGSWWNAAGYDEANINLSNVVCTVGPVKEKETVVTDSVTYTKDKVVLESVDALTIEENPFYGKNIDNFYIEYTINMTAGTARNGWDGIFSFYNSGTTGRISFQTAPYICMNDAAGKWMDVNQPSDDAIGNMAPSMAYGTDYKVTISVTKEGIVITVDGVEIEYSLGSSGMTYEQMISYITKCDQLTWGVGAATTAYWYTEKCTLTDITFSSVGGTVSGGDEEEVVKGSGVITAEEVVLGTNTAMEVIDNPLRNADGDAISVEYTINFNKEAIRSGWDGLFSFYNSTSIGRVSFQSAPYICYNDMAGKWIDINQPNVELETCTLKEYGLETGVDYTVNISITEDAVKMYLNGVEVAIAENSSGATYGDMISYIKSCDQFTWGVGAASTAFWYTELCTLKNVSILSYDSAETTLETPVVSVKTEGRGSAEAVNTDGNATITAKAGRNYTFEGWYAGAILIGTEETMDISVCKDVEVLAVFTALPAKLDMSYKTISSWCGYTMGSVTLTNISEETLKSWSVEFTYEGKISSLWGAKLVSQNDTKVIVDAPMWAKNLKAGESVTFYFIANTKGLETIPQPSGLDLLSAEETDAEEISYTAQITRKSQWWYGYVGSCDITNIGDVAMDQWTIEFDYEDEITSVWGGKIVSHEGDHYVITNAGYNSVINPGETTTIGFMGKPADGQRYSTAEMKNVSITSVLK